MANLHERYQGLNREQLEKVTDVLVNLSLHFAGAQYTEYILRGACGLGDKELAAMGFDVDTEWADMDTCMEV